LNPFVRPALKDGYRRRTVSQYFEKAAFAFAPMAKLQLTCQSTKVTVPQSELTAFIAQNPGVLSKPTYELKARVPAPILEEFAKAIESRRKPYITKQNVSSFVLLARELCHEVCLDECASVLSTMQADSFIVLNQRVGIVETLIGIRRHPASSEPQMVISRLSTLEADLATLRQSMSHPSPANGSVRPWVSEPAVSQAPAPIGRLEVSPTDLPTPTVSEQTLLDLINGFRQENGLEPLEFSRKITAICVPHTLSMFSKEIPAGHQGAPERYKQIPESTHRAENVAFTIGHANPLPDMVTNWKNSPGHKKNMMGDFNTVGVALVHDDRTWFATTLFAKF
jgi:uncharacterized protein YkwD